MPKQDASQRVVFDAPKPLRLGMLPFGKRLGPPRIVALAFNFSREPRSNSCSFLIERSCDRHLPRSAGPQRSAPSKPAARRPLGRRVTPRGIVLGRLCRLEALSLVTTVVRLPKPAFQRQPLGLSEVCKALTGGLEPQVKIVPYAGLHALEGERRDRALDHAIRDGRAVLGDKPVVELDKGFLAARTVALVKGFLAPAAPLTAVPVSALGRRQTLSREGFQGFEDRQILFKVIHAVSIVPTLYGQTSVSAETAIFGGRMCEEEAGGHRRPQRFRWARE
jgi:hypothetical protein